MADSMNFPTMSEVRRQHLINVLEYTGGKKDEAARILDVSVRTVRNWCNEFGLTLRYKACIQGCKPQKRLLCCKPVDTAPK